MKTILVLDKVLLQNTRQEIIRGAELFNIALINDLSRLGFQITIIAAITWKQRIEELLPKEHITFRYLPPFRVAWINAVIASILMLGKRFDYLLLGNVGNSVISAILLLYRCKGFSRMLIIAHRTASQSFLKLLKAIPSTVIAVNNSIAEQFKAGGFTNVAADYGIVGADKFYPDPNRPTNQETRFLVFGSLDSSWKGADTAVSAFLKLPLEVQNTSSLHLAGYSNPVLSYGSERIKAYSWISTKDVPLFLRSFDVLLVPSRDTDQMKETFSQTTVQGMLSGLPIIVSNIPVLVEKAADGAGLIFSDESELTGQMEMLHKNIVLRQQMGANARRRALKYYAWNTNDFVDKYL